VSEQNSIERLLERDPETGRFAKPAPEAATPPPEPQAAPATEQATPPEQPAAAPQSPSGDKPTPTASPAVDPVQAELAGLKAELARLRAQRREAPAPKPEPVKPPSVFDDEEGYTRHLTRNVDDIVFDRVLAMSDYNAKREFQDFAEVMGTEGSGQDEVHTKWVGLIQRDPALYDKFRTHPHPVAFAYQELKRRALLDEIGEDPKAYKARIRAELEAELRGQPGAQPAAVQAPAKPEPIVPQTLAGQPSKAARSAPEWSGPKPLDDILAAKKWTR